MSRPDAVSVVIPTLNAAAFLPHAVAQFAPAIADGLVTTVVVSDGGSRDGTVGRAEAAGAVVVQGPAGRGGQLVRGAQAACAPWLLFVHADTRLASGWIGAVRDFIASQGEDRAAAFAFALDDDAPAARRLERMVAWRCRLLALPYGDQGLLISRRLHYRLGGFRPIALMEDVEFVRRIGRGRLRMLPVSALTSAARYRRDGYLRRSLGNLGCLTLYFMGVPPRVIARLYG